VQPAGHCDADRDDRHQNGNDAAHIAVLALAPVEC
jgi:hypothetical protein